MRRAIAIGVALAIAAGCAPKPEKPPPSSVRAARQAALEFDQRMKREIVDRLERGEDVVAVYLAYADHAPGWGKEISDAARIDFSRTALTTRNPANSPDDWERRQMEQMSFMLDTGIDPETMEVTEIVVEGEEKVFRWMRPLLMGETCLACHGETIDGRVKQLLAQEYPLDDATGYSEGQMGGAYSVRQVLSVGGKLPPPYQPKPDPPALPADARSPDDAPLVTPPT